MKILVTILTAAHITSLATADISLTSGFKPSSSINNSPHPYSRQQSEQVSKPQQLQTISQPSLKYLPQHEQLSQFSHHPAVKPGRRYRPRTRIPKRPIVTKNFYLHSAPDDTEEEIEQELAAWHQQPRKHYNVLFVKAPSQTNKVAALNLAKSLKQEKTVVYVLAKKTSVADLQDAVEETPQANNNNKPEVFFIKYRTAEEAANAQRQIQAQYDSLGGVTTINDEGIAPSTSVIGSLDATDEDGEEQEEEEGEEEQEYSQSAEQQHEQSSEQSSPAVANASDQSGQQKSDTNVYLPPQY